MLQITTTEREINVLSKKEFNKSIDIIYKENSPADVRKAIIDFYKNNIADDDTLYNRYRFLKMDSEVLGPVFFGALFGFIVSSCCTSLQNLPSNIKNVGMLFCVFLIYFVLIAIPVWFYPCTCMRKDTLLIKPTEIVILEKLLDIKPML